MVQDEGEYVLNFVSSAKFYLIPNGIAVWMKLPTGTTAEVSQRKIIMYYPSWHLGLGVVIILCLITAECFWVTIPGPKRLSIDFLSECRHWFQASHNLCSIPQKLPRCQDPRPLSFIFFTGAEKTCPVSFYYDTSEVLTPLIQTRVDEKEALWLLK